MAGKKIGLGILVMVLAFGMSVTEIHAQSTNNVPGLVGVWEGTGEAEGQRWEFLQGGTGSMSFEGIRVGSFTWSAENGRLRIAMFGETEVMSYTISGSRLTLTGAGDDEVLIFTRVR